MADDFDFPLKEYYDEDLIELIVEDTAHATKRGAEKAAEWLDKLHKQDIVTVGDLRDLQEEDWGNLYVFLSNVLADSPLTHPTYRGLTVFANRALKNALYGKPARNVASVTSKSGTLSRAGSTTSNSNTPAALPPPALPPS
jgi:hypothetical protein